MGRNAVITQEDVTSAAEKIHALGARPTARAIREEIGGGSMATVLKFLQAWQGKQKHPLDASPTLPIGLQKALVDCIAQEVNAAKTLLASELATAQQANTDLIAESEEQAAVIDKQLIEISALQAEKSELTGRLTQIANDLADAKASAEEQRKIAASALIGHAKLELRLEGIPALQAEVEKLRSALDAERVSRVASDQAAAVAAAKFAMAEGQVSDLQKRLAKSDSILKMSRL